MPSGTYLQYLERVQTRFLRVVGVRTGFDFVNIIQYARTKPFIAEIKIIVNMSNFKYRHSYVFLYLFFKRLLMCSIALIHPVLNN